MKCYRGQYVQIYLPVTNETAWRIGAADEALTDQVRCNDPPEPGS